MPAITAEAGLVPWADVGMRQTVRWSSPRLRWYARIVSRPVYSPIAPELGCSETAREARDLGDPRAQLLDDRRVARGLRLAGANGCTFAQPGIVTGIISAAALSFIVQLPSGIIACASERSLFSRRFRKRIISVSER